jgi:hypothetical protein
MKKRKCRDLIKLGASPSPAGCGQIVVGCAS